MYSLTFRINLKDTEGHLLSPAEAEIAAQAKSTFTSIGLLGGSPSIVRKHGDIVTLYDQEAVNLKRLVEAGQAPEWELYTAPATAATLEITTDSLEVENLNIHMTATIGNGGDSVIEYGFVYAANTDSPTTSDHVSTMAFTPFTGSYEDSLTLPFTLDGITLTDGANPVWVAAYAINADGTVYGNAIQSDPNPWLCLMAGTRVSLPNGYKNIENVDYSDTLLVWNFDTARLDKAKPIWIMKPFTRLSYALVKFSDGSSLGTIDDGKGHSIFNIEKGMFTNMMSSPIGTTTYTRNGKVKIVNKKIVHEKTTFYNVVTNEHMNMFTNGILTSTRLNNIYPIRDMRFVKEARSSEYSGISDELVAGLRLTEQPVDVTKKVLRMVDRQLQYEMV